jgi:hypothetical protein
MVGEEGDELVESGVTSNRVGYDEASSHSVDAGFGIVCVELGEEEFEWVNG